MWAVELKNLNFAYGGGAPVFAGAELTIERGSRVLLIGANGAGKSTLLQLLAGRHLIPGEGLRVFGKDPFHDVSLSSRIALVDGDFPLTVDLRVSELLDHPTPGVDGKIQKQLLELLEVDPGWRMCRVSEGQRRRVQLLLALRRPVELLLLDEVTSHLDIVGRADLLTWLRARNEQAGTTVVYTTHILDGLDGGPGKSRWPTHLALLSHRKPFRFSATDQIPELRTGSLLSLAESWIRNR